MKKYVFLMAAACSMMSCDFIMKGQDEAKTGPTGNEKVVIGNDKDDKGCVISAGYRWSLLKNDCIRPLEEGYRLNSIEQVEGESTFKSSFVTFDENKEKGELFLPDTRSSILLTKGKNGAYSDKHWTLSLANGYRLQKDGQLLYVGAAVQEGQVTGDDKEED
jgi:hypothetical protein